MSGASPRRFRRITVALVLAWSGAAATAAFTGGPVQDEKTILDRIYSVKQAERGESLFKRSCTGCHAATDFAGGMVASHWEGGNVGDVYDIIANYMPANDPGSLKPQEAADIVAFFLHMDGYPVGYDDMPGDSAVLSKIGIVPNPK